MKTRITICTLLIGIIGLMLLGIDTSYSKEKETTNLNLIQPAKAQITDISNNKIIIIGDSRFEFIVNDSKDNLIEIPSSVHIIAKSGAGINWFINSALKTLDEYINNSKHQYNYHIVLNVGVNDINYNEKYKQVARQYISEYKKLALKYPQAKLYILSINPIDDEVLNQHEPANIRTTDKILTFNNILAQSTIYTEFSNITYCDSYHEVKFEIPDGIHYDNDTNKRILNYIASSCVQYVTN